MECDWKFVRGIVEKRDRGVCAICEVDTEWLQQVVRLMRAAWHGDPNAIEFKLISDFSKRMLGGRTCSSPWEADHIVPRHDRGPDHPDNLRTLCVPCHARVTAQFARERAERRRKAKLMTQPTLLPVAAPEVITISVNCIPKGQPRLKSSVRIGKHGKNAGRAFAHHYTPDTADAFKRAVQLAANRLSGRRHEGPVQLDLTAYFARTEKKLIKGRGLVEICHVPPGAPTCAIPMTSTPDRDNLDKVVLDALTEIGVWCDDAQVYTGKVSKYFAAANCVPGVKFVITLEPWPEWKKQPKKKKGS